VHADIGSRVFPLAALLYLAILLLFDHIPKASAA
jgi:hypothetical protein